MLYNLGAWYQFTLHVCCVNFVESLVSYEVKSKNNRHTNLLNYIDTSLVPKKKIITMYMCSYLGTTTRVQLPWNHNTCYCMSKQKIITRYMCSYLGTTTRVQLPWNHNTCYCMSKHLRSHDFYVKWMADTKASVRITLTTK